MRDDYIKQLVAALSEIEKTPDAIQTLKENAVLWGATEEEFKEAVKQTTTHSTKPPQSKVDNKLVKKLLEFDLALHGVVMILLGLLAVFLLNTFQPQTDLSPKQALNAEPKNLIPPVYAKTAEVDTQQVFSYPEKPLTLSISGTPKKEIYGYFPYWMVENQAAISLTPVTTLSYFGLSIDGTGSIITRTTDGTIEKGWQTWSSPQLSKLISRAKKQNIHLELTLKSFSNKNIESLVSSDEAQKRFINNAIQLIQAQAFDGINLDFEYSGTPNEKVQQDFSRLVTNLKSEMTRQVPNATLSLSTYINEAAIPRLIDIEAVSQDVDNFVIMGYDFHTPSGEPGPIAPLDGPVSIIGYMQSYLEKLPPDKLILALPHYGYDWQEGSKEKEAHSIIPFIVAGEESKKYQVQWDAVSQTPWFRYNDNTTHSERIVHFENVRSLGLKYDYINKKDLKGVGIWAMGYEGNSTEIQSLLQQKFIQ